MELGFTIFIDYWLREENKIKKKKWLKKRKDLFEAFILNRRFVYFFEMFLNLLETSEEDVMDDLYSLLQKVANELGTEKEVCGICSLCEQSWVVFQKDETGQHLTAFCRGCKEIHFLFLNVYE